jgi:hypothetical protein
MSGTVNDHHGQSLAIGKRVRRLLDHTGSDYAGIITWIEPTYQITPDGTEFHAVEVTRDNGATYMTFSDKVVLAPRKLPAFRKLFHRLTTRSGRPEQPPR